MRGPKPEELTIAPEDRPQLEMIAHRRQWPWFQVQRAKVILALAAGQRSEILAAGMGSDRTTIWRIAHCYEDRGLEGLLAEGTRPGHPPEISAPPASPDRRSSPWPA